jgi:mannose-6-phosphate isomerase-like protein (cupin superfamily)
MGPTSGRRATGNFVARPTSADVLVRPISDSHETLFPLLSLQKHFHRAEHWVVVKGTAEVAIGDNDRRCTKTNRSTGRSAMCTASQIREIPLELIEAQVDSYLGEDDIVRIEDVYRRE